MLATRLTLGSDVAGNVEAVGDEATGVAAGDAVYGLLPLRTAPCRVHRPAGANMACKPTSLNYIHAAAVLPVSNTARQAVIDIAGPAGRVGARPWSRGGIGSFAAQLAKQTGA